ncbi:MAG: glycosyltransferase [Synergistaceae bacterium]|nr:glycosyltransferase [Synergistaceae bacterium]
MRQLVSVVAPAYNVRDKIECSLRSLLEQDYDPIEIIVVDDASSDGTAEKADRLLKTGGRRYRILRNARNSGVSASRNAGLRDATGRYVLFMDADDKADANFISTLHGTIAKNDSDAAFCGFRDYFEDTGREEAVPIKLDSSRTYPGEELAAKRILTHFGAVFTTLFKTSFLRGARLEFPEECRFGEDYEFIVKAFSRCGSVAVSTECPYVYVHSQGNASASSLSSMEKHFRRYADITASTLRIANYLKEHSASPKLLDIADNLLVPEYFMRVLTLAAKESDMEKFNRTLAALDVKRLMFSTGKYAARKPELFLKAICIFASPKLFYRVKSRS